MLPMEKTWRAAPTVIQPSAPRSQQLFLDKERELQLPTPPDSGAPLSPERKAWAQAFTCLIFPSLGWQAGTALCAYLPPPSPAGLKAAAEGGFPRYYNNQPATARSDPLRRRLRPGAEDA